MSITAPGLRALVADLHDLAADAADTDAVDRETAQQLADEARTRARRRTGLMAASIVAGVGYVDVTARYAPHVHDGRPAGQGRSPNPFVAEAVTAVPVVDLYADHLDDVTAHNIRSRY